MEDSKETNINENKEPEPAIESAQFSQMAPEDISETKHTSDELPNLELILDVSVPISVELGRSTMLIKDILALTQGSIVELERVAGAPVDLLVRGKLLAKGEVVVVEDHFGLKITSVCGSEERIKSLG